MPKGFTNENTEGLTGNDICFLQLRLGLPLGLYEIVIRQCVCVNESSSSMNIIWAFKISENATKCRATVAKIMCLVVWIWDLFLVSLKLVIIH